MYLMFFLHGFFPQSSLSLARQLGSGLRWPTPEWPRGKGKRLHLKPRHILSILRKLDNGSTMPCFLLMTARVVSRADERRAGLYTVACHDINRPTRTHRTAPICSFVCIL